MKVQQFNYLDIGEKCTMKEQLNIDRYAIWNKLFQSDELDSNISDDKINDSKEDEIF